MANIGHLINGKTVVESSTRRQSIFNPATGEISGEVSLASKNTVEEAIAAAEVAFPAWRNTAVGKRAAVMFRFKELLKKMRL